MALYRRALKPRGRVANMIKLSFALWLACAPATVMVAGVWSSDAVAAKRRKRSVSKRKRPQKRKIRKEGSLAPKKDLELDDTITKTKDLKIDLEQSSRPSLTPQQLQQQNFEALLDDKLEEEVKLTQDLLKFESGCEGTSPVRFRLADLYWEKSKRAFFKANDFNTAEASRKRYQVQMKRLQKQTISHYQTIADDCPSYKEYPKVLFYLGKTLMELDRPAEGAKYLKEIIRDYGDSQWLANAWFMVGEFYFNDQGDARKALKAYEKAAEDRGSTVYGFAVYKQGWCYINTGDWDLALERFKRVVKISGDPGQTLDQRGRLSLRKEALKDYVRSYSNIGEAKRAYADFLKLGGKGSVGKMMEQLGNWYISRDAHSDVITVYKDLIRQFPKSTRLPVFQGRIVSAASKLGDDKATVANVRKLTRYFGTVRKRISSGKLSDKERETVAKDVREAEEIAENTLRRLALEYHKEAKKLRGRARDRNYKYALDLYKHYLEVFPKPKAKADVNYVFYMRYYFAEVLFELEKFTDAADNYDQVIAMNSEPRDDKERQIILRAAEDSVRAYDEVVQDYDRKHKLKVSGTKPKPIPAIKQRLIDACRRYIGFVGEKGDRIVEIRYKMARIYYTYNHFSEAAPAFDDIVENHPKHEVACYAANLALDIYNGQKDYAAVRKAARSYKTENKLSCGEEEMEKFSQIEEQATFLLIKKLEEKKDYISAGNAYMNFYRQYGRSKTKRSKFAVDAVYNAAVNYDLGQRLAKANEVREFLVKTFDPKSELVIETLFNIAQSYERVVDFAKAAQWYDDFAAKYPSDKRTKDAIFNAGLYRATLREFDGARTARRKYLKLYPNASDAAEVHFSMCETMEKEAALLDDERKGSNARWTAAHDCYFSWVKNKAYASKETDLLCHAQFRRGEIMREKTRYDKGYAEMLRYLNKMWPSWKGKKSPKGLPRCSADMAELKFRSLAGRFSKYTKLSISELNPTKKKRFDASIAAKTKERDALIAAYKGIVEIGVAEWALASLFMIGEAYQNSIDRLLQARIPDRIPGYKLTEDDKASLRNQLKEMATPIEGLAIEAFQFCVDKANELGVYNKWSVKARKKLQELRPEEFTPLVESVPSLAFLPPLAVVKNTFIVKDGEGFKPLTSSLLEKAPAPKAVETPSPAPGQKKKKAPKKAKSQEGRGI